MPTLGQRLKELIAEKGITQRKLAEFLEYDDTTISMYCSGNRTPDIETLKRISEFFDCSIDYITGLSDIREVQSNKNLKRLLEFAPPLDEFVFDPSNAEYINFAYRIKERGIDLKDIDELVLGVPSERLSQEMDLIKRFRKRSIDIDEIESFTLKVKNIKWAKKGFNVNPFLHKFDYFRVML